MSTSIRHPQQTRLLAATAPENPSVHRQRRDSRSLAVGFASVALLLGLAAFGQINATVAASCSVISETHQRKATGLWFRNTAPLSNFQ